jgi:hypothetical protein
MSAQVLQQCQRWCPEPHRLFMSMGPEVQSASTSASSAAPAGTPDWGGWDHLKFSAGESLNPGTAALLHAAFCLHGTRQHLSPPGCLWRCHSSGSCLHSTAASWHLDMLRALCSPELKMHPSKRVVSISGRVPDLAACACIQPGQQGVLATSGAVPVLPTALEQSWLVRHVRALTVCLNYACVPDP